MNPPSLLQRILGANSKVRFFVLLLVVSYAVLRFPKVLDGLPDDIKQGVFFVANEALHIALAAALWFVKQNNVSGNGTVDDPHRIAKPDGSVTVPLILFFALASALLCTGCENGRYVGPALTFGGSYTQPDGSAIGGTVRLDPSFLRAKKGASIALPPQPKTMARITLPNIGRRVYFPGIRPHVKVDLRESPLTVPLPTLYDEKDKPIYPLVVTSVRD